MGRFVNPDNSAFQVALNSEIYVDKTDLISYTNRVMNTDRALICNSRPRRFGKSVTANMLVAYYSKGCDSRKMFDGLAVSRNAAFERYLNQCDVIHFDVQWCMSPAKGADAVVSFIENSVIRELREEFPGILPQMVDSLADAMSCINTSTGRKFVVIIDEWDVLIRDEAANQKIQEEYINFLRGLFKGSEPTKFLALAFLTGILPIKKLKTQSALNNFTQFTMLSPGPLAAYTGFTETEVRELCRKYDKDFEEVKRWYDGYLLGEYQIYNPNAVVSLMIQGEFQSYWSQTGTYESIVPLINMDFDGLKTSIITMISGERVPVRTKSYQNDMITFKNKDDVMTALIHLGYLGYDQENQTAYIPNEEIRSEFTDAVEENSWEEFIEFRKQSMDLLEATIRMDEEAVAEGIEKIHMEYASSIQYHDENSLSSVLTIAYLSAMKYYFKPVRELPTGKGFADFVFVPKQKYTGKYPVLLVELKWDKDADTAIRQIREKKYPDALLEYTGNILLVGIIYDKKNKKHECVIERFEK